jgi:hypothetical protein
MDDWQLSQKGAGALVRNEVIAAHLNAARSIRGGRGNMLSNDVVLFVVHALELKTFQTLPKAGAMLPSIGLCDKPAALRLEHPDVLSGNALKPGKIC